MEKHRDITLERLQKFTQELLFSDVNLRSVLWKKKWAEGIELSVYAVPDLKRITFAEATNPSNEYRPARVGESFGPSWATFWFRVSLTMPKELAGEEVVYFTWDANCEAMIWTKDGQVVTGLTGGRDGNRRADWNIKGLVAPGNKLEFYVELACNGLFGVGGPGTDIAPSQPDRYFTLDTCELRVPDLLAWDLWYDFEIVTGMARNLPADSDRGNKALWVANRMVNLFMKDDRRTWEAARQAAKEILQARNAEGTHSLSAIGHCHIDTAWLWPYGETKRKAARSWAAQIRLMEEYPEHKFACSQMQQLEWMKQLYPGLFDEIKKYAKLGRFIPIGGTWVEMDCNIPSGEAFVRQFLYGQRFMRENFEMTSKVFWLPDTFGYSSQLPQIVRHTDGEYFFTQKLSWNNINKFPHTTFYWKALDGTPVLTHFSPTDTYNAQCTVDEMLFSVSNNKDLPYTSEGLVLFGNGDGGGGPTKPMLERLRRLRDVAGLPKVEIGDVNEFYQRLEKTSRDLAVWKGELYFELHRGTYTTQAHTKRSNRKSELLLRNVEFLSAISMWAGGNNHMVPTAPVRARGERAGFRYPKDELDRLWKLVLLNQFHDVLPGSSITEVYKDAAEYYADVKKSGEALFAEAVVKLLDAEDLKACSPEPIKSGSSEKRLAAVFNTTRWSRTDVIEVPLDQVDASARDKFAQKSADGRFGLVLASDVPAMGFRTVDVAAGQGGLEDLQSAGLKPVKVEVVNNGATFWLENAFVRVCIEGDGRISSFFEHDTQREFIVQGELGNRFKYFEDIPLFWDAWDVEIYHLEKSWDAGAGVARIIEGGPLRSVMLVEHKLSPTSTLTQKIILHASSPVLEFHTNVEWHESRKFLKVEFPFDVMSDVATYETAFGVVTRPTHQNTSWDMAKFEVCGHKFADLSEFGSGIALLNDCKYGYSTRGNVMRLSLLRSPKAPDDHADMGSHEFKYALYPHKHAFLGSEVVREGYLFNVEPFVRMVTLANPPPADAPSQPLSVSYIRLLPGGRGEPTSRNVVIDTIKRAEDEPDSVIVRLYEAYGGRATASVETILPVAEAHECNGLEENGRPLEVLKAGGKCVIEVPVMPFKIITLKLKLAREAPSRSGSPKSDGSWEKL
ncbi:galactose mutarotase-like domain-containing protein [Hyaloraphidium curvatum]|nr:galactose mutarotase-like domain-containing protein [Hyaloraphidium curvatum]